MVVVYFIVDKELMYICFVDEVVCIGLVSVVESYLNILAIISVVEIIGVNVIYLGYGFLVENVDFVEWVIDSGFIFIGFRVEIICLMGNKVLVIEVMKIVGVFCVLGLDGLFIDDNNEIFKMGCQIGYLVIIKAAFGGGGCGMCVVYQEKDLIKFISLICFEVCNVFGDDIVYMEKFLIIFWYVEIQVLVDIYGNVIYLGDWDCFL